MTLVAQHPDSSADNPNGESITGVVGPMVLVEDTPDEDDDDHKGKHDNDEHGDD